MSHFVVAAGGTGGHMVPASVTAGELRARGHRVTLMTDARGLRFPGLFEGIPSQLVDALMPRFGNPLAALRTVVGIVKARMKAKAFLRAEDVDAVIGFGGYPSLPPLLAALALDRPALLHEQNAVFGRTNRLLAIRAAKIATSFVPTQRLLPRDAGKTVVTGLPVRAEVRAIADMPYPDPSGTLELLIIGGSQGASILSRVVPAAIALLPVALRTRLRVVQQCRESDLDGVRAAYAEQGTAAVCEAYFADLPARLAAAHLVIARSGASTMAELAAAGRPAILVPFAAAKDDHQTANAAEFVAAGGGPLLTEAQFTPEALADAIVSLTDTPHALRNAAAAAKSVGRPGAGARLADLAEALDLNT